MRHSHNICDTTHIQLKKQLLRLPKVVEGSLGMTYNYICVSERSDFVANGSCDTALKISQDFCVVKISFFESLKKEKIKCDFCPNLTD